MATGEAHKKKPADEKEAEHRTLTQGVNALFNETKKILDVQSKKFGPDTLKYYEQAASEKRSGATEKAEEKRVAEAGDILNKFVPARDDAKKSGEKGPLLTGPVKREGALETMAFVKAVETARDDPAKLNIRRWVNTEAKAEVA